MVQMPIRKKSQWMPFLWIETLQSYVLGEGWSGGIVVLLGPSIISIPEVASRMPQMVSSTQATDKGKKNHYWMQMKITKRHHLTLVRMAMIKKSTNNKCCRECEEKGTFLCSWWEYKMVQPRGRTAWRFPKKLKIALPYDRAIYSWA